MDDGSGTTVADTSGSGHTGAISGTPAWVPGKIGTALNFTAAGQKVTFPPVYVSNTNSVAMWVYATGGPSSYQTLLANNCCSGIFFRLPSLKVSDIYNGDNFAGTPLTVNQWHHVAVVSNNGAVTFYVDGVASGTASGLPGWGWQFLGDNGGNPFQGAIDEVLVYNRALTAQEVSTIYNYAGGAAPVISSFTASPSAVVPGGSSTLSWNAPGATSISISPGNLTFNTPSGSTPVSPAVTTTYTLMATNSSGSATATTTVTVTSQPLPVISSFGSSPTTIMAGSSSILSWLVSGANTVSIDQGIGTVGASGSLRVAPFPTTTFTLTATSAAGPVSASTTITVTPAGNGLKYQAGPGQTISMGADLTLSNTDSAEFVGTAQNPCTILANGFRIYATDNTWTGHLYIQNCNINNLGTSATHALELRQNQASSVDIENTTWAMSSDINITSSDTSTVTFKGNTIQSNAVFVIDYTDSTKGAAFYGGGASTGAKIFQSNKIYLGYIQLDSSYWTVGGGSDPLGNLIIGQRAGIFMNGSNSTVKHNYIHMDLSVSQAQPFWHQAIAFTFGSSDLVDSNVIRSAQWVMRGIQGSTNSEVSNNVALEVAGHYFLQSGAAKVHHNIFSQIYPLPSVYGDPTVVRSVACVTQPYTSDALSFYNNICDGSNAAYTQAVEIYSASVMPSLRNNVFYNMNIQPPNTSARAIAGPDNINPEPITTPPPNRLAYADYNDFHYDPSTTARNNYALGVAGLTERTSSGYGLHDLHVGGPVDENVDPMFQGPVSTSFPYQDSDIAAGNVTVSQILTYYRNAFTPAAGSPLVGAQDPQDGAGNIGVVQTAVTPAAPTIQSFTASPNTVQAGQSATLSWSTTGATSIAITPGTFTSTAAIGSTSVSPANTNTYTLTASNSSGSATATATVTVTPLNPDMTAPTVPTGVSATAQSSTAVSLTWSGSADPTVNGAVTSGVAGYRIFRGTSANSLAQIGTTTSTSYSDQDLNASTTYYYAVAAYDNASNVSEQSTPPASATTQAPPTTVTVTFQQGVGGYTGSEDNEVDIGRSNPNNVYPNGGSAYPFAIGTEYCGYACEKMLIRFKNLNISGTITNVKLVLKEYYQQASGTLFASKISKPDWDTNAVNWYNYKTGTAWTNPGGDYGSPLATFAAPGGGQTVTIDLGANFTAAELQQNGIVITSNIPTYYFTWFYCNEATNPADRPMLIVTYNSTPPPLPTIQSFTSSPSAIQSGQSSSLSWATTSATNISITPGTFTSNAASGSTSVSPSSTTTYTLTASNSVGSATATTTVTVTQLNPDVTAPTVPTGVSATAQSSATINLTWNASTDSVVSGAVTSGVAGYQIYRGAAPNAMAQIGTTTTASYSDQNLDASTTYYYAVAAYDNASNVSGQSSPPASATTQAPPTTVTVNFQQGVGGYTGSEDNEVDIARGNPNTVYPNGGSVYPFAIGSEYCGYACEKMLIRFKNLNISGTITNVKLQLKEYYQQGGSSSLFASKVSKPDWDTNAVNWYNYKTGTAWTNPGGDYGPALATFAATGAGQTVTIDLGTNFSLAELQQNGIVITSNIPTYYDTWFYSNEATNPGDRPMLIVTYDGTPPPVPTIQSFSAIPSAIQTAQTSTLSWNTISATTISITPGTFTSNLASGSTTVSPSATTTYTLTASNITGNVTATTTVTVTQLSPDVTPPTVPTSLSATPQSDAVVNLSWTASTDPTVSGAVTSGVAGYVIYRGTTPNNLIQIGTTATTSYSDTGLTGNTTYYYSVSAYDNANNPSGQFTPPVSAITQPTPTTVTVTFQQGIGGYTGSEDNEVDIARGSPNNVYASGGSAYPFAVGADYCGYACEKMLIRFKNLNISGTITNVKLVLKQYYQQGGSNSLFASKISKADWDTNTVNWYNYKAGTPWTSAGGDYGSPLATFAAAGAGQTVTIDLGANFTAAELQQNGIVITSNIPTYYNTWFYCNEATSAGDRPKLVVTYQPASSAPTIQSFSASPSNITNGQTSTLSWSSANASSIAITPGSFTSTAASGSTTVSPSATTTYTLTATNQYGSTTAQTTVTLGPLISSVSSGNITSSTATITWVTDTLSDTQLDYGTTQAYGQSSALDPTQVTLHTVNLSALLPATLYHFRMKSRDNNGNLTVSGDFTFSTETATYQLGPGQSITLTSDIVLTNTDTIDFIGAAGNPCTINGGGHQIRTVDNTWTGHLRIQYCTVQSLGTVSLPALQIDNYGTGYLDIEHSDWQASSDLQFRNYDNTAATFIANTFEANSVFPVDKDLNNSRFAIYGLQEGQSPAQKIFESNKILRGTVNFSSPNWIVGGATDALGNISVGFRAGIQVVGPGSLVQHNYTHVNLTVDPVTYPYFTQVHNFVLGANSVAENNVFRTGHWVARQIDGEMRNNVVLEVQAHQFVQAGAGQVHHNIFSGIYPGPNRIDDPRVLTAESIVEQPYSTDALQFYNNTIDMRGVTGLGIELDPNTLMPSMRNNIFYGVSTSGAVVGPNVSETLTDPGPARLGYTDYNCFYYDPATPLQNNYAITVAGLTERVDTGFALHDLPVAGPKDASVDPIFKGPLPSGFPFNDSDILSGAVTVSQILAYYRDAYSPAQNSPVIGAGDPQDGPGVSIGAVEVAGGSSADQTPPTVPYNLSGQAISSSQISLAWNPSTDPEVSGQVSSGVAGYKVYRGTSPSSLSQIAILTGISYSDTFGLSAATTYYYAVSSYDNAGNESTKTTPIQVMTQAPAPITVTFQNGMNGYVGSEDNEIDTGRGGPSAVYASGGTVYPFAIGNMYCSKPCSEMLIRFKNLGITGTITGVQLQLREYGQQAGSNYLYAAKVTQPNWDTNATSWLNYQANLPWSAPGGDYGPALVKFSAPGPGNWVTIDLGTNFSVSELQQNGIIINTDVLSYYDIWFYCNETSNPSDRPKLIVSYTP
jgi:hypothetical protein